MSESVIAELAKIEREVTRLRGTELFDFRVQNKSFPVIGDGDPQADIMFVGEAPGKNEAKTGKPFCGAAGKILDDLLTIVKLEREDVYITNIVKDRPPKNRDPLPAEIKLYAPFLDRQIEAIQPKVIATLGRFASEYVMERFGLKDQIEPISVIHGKIFDAELSFGTIKILPLYHPAAAIYNRSLIEKQKEDITQLKKII